GSRWWWRPRSSGHHPGGEQRADYRRRAGFHHLEVAAVDTVVDNVPADVALPQFRSAHSDLAATFRVDEEDVSLENRTRAALDDPDQVRGCLRQVGQDLFGKAEGLGNS